MYFIFDFSFPILHWGVTRKPWIEKKLKLKKSKQESVSGMLGISYIADKSRHPV